MYHKLDMIKRRIGRPPGPSGIGPRPWFRRRLRKEDKEILEFVARHLDMPRWEIAEKFGLSGSALSILTCSPLGQAYMRRVIEEECDLH
jgi:hypothetical protein